jgi:tRNA G18 (ribose-2'-O)-methylase SpoU
MENSDLGEKCPRCSESTNLINDPYVSREVDIQAERPPQLRVEALLDNIRSVYNVGSIFRTADAVGVSHLHLCGITPTPENPKLAKTALDSERTVEWTHHNDGLAAAIALKKQGRRLWALEAGERSGSLFEAVSGAQGAPLLLVVGNEVSGIDPAIQAQCRRVVYIPMQGVKRSLNVGVAFSIAAYVLRYQLTVPADSA